MPDETTLTDEELVTDPTWTATPGVTADADGDDSDDSDDSDTTDSDSGDDADTVDAH